MEHWALSISFVFFICDNLETKHEPTRGSLELLVLLSSESYGETAHMRSLAICFTAHTHKTW